MGRPKALRIVDKRMERAKKNHQLKGDTKAALLIQRCYRGHCARSMRWRNSADGSSSKRVKRREAAGRRQQQQHRMKRDGLRAQHAGETCVVAP